MRILGRKLNRFERTYFKELVQYLQKPRVFFYLLLLEENMELITNIFQGFMELPPALTKHHLPCPASARAHRVRIWGFLITHLALNIPLGNN